MSVWSGVLGCEDGRVASSPGCIEYNRVMNTQTRLANLIKADLGAGKKVKWLEIDAKDRASLIDEISKAKGPLAKHVKTSGIDVAMPTLDGVPIRWQAATTKTSFE
jgi:hypothetical protein